MLEFLNNEAGTDWDKDQNDKYLTKKEKLILEVGCVEKKMYRKNVEKNAEKKPEPFRNHLIEAVVSAKKNRNFL